MSPACEAAADEIDSLRADAARWRYVRDHVMSHAPFWSDYLPREFTDLIDAAIKEVGGSG